MTNLYIDKILSVLPTYKWETSTVCVPAFGKREAVQLANSIRGLGYKVEINETPHMCFVNIHRPKDA